MKAIIKSKIKYPEQRNWKAKLQIGDKEKIAGLTASSGKKYAKYTIRDMLNGYRLMPDTVKVIILKILSDREELNKTLDEISKQQPLLP